MVTSIAINTNYSIQHNSFICTQSNGSKYCYVIPIFQFRHTVKGITNNLLIHQLFVYKQLNDQTVLFLTIQFSISHFFAQNLSDKQFYWTYR